MNNFTAEQIIDIVDTDWEIGGEVCCSYSDDDFDLQDECENVEDECENEENECIDNDVIQTNDERLLREYELEPEMTGCSILTVNQDSISPTLSDLNTNTDMDTSIMNTIIATAEQTEIIAGPKLSLPFSLLGIFQLFFTSELLQLIAENTNLYAKQVLGEEKFQQFVQVTEPEINAYFGFMILMGINHLPSLFDYWKTGTTLFSPIATRITRARFFEISRFLHFVDNTAYTISRTDPDYDRVWKIRPIIDALSESFLESYTPHFANSIDEAMIPFKGRSMMKQYIPLKPIKRGIKVWVRADAVNGYVSQFQVYLGKTRGSPERYLGERVVKDLTRPLVGQQYTIYCDNFFSSPKLFQDLLKDGIHACGTLRSNRIGYPEEFKKFLKKGLSEH